MIVSLLTLAALHVRPDHQAASRSERREPVVHDWSGVAECESGGDWHINSGNGFYGGLQFTAATFAAFGGHGRADLASPAEQIRVAERVLRVQGPGAWPICSQYLRAA